MDDVIAVATKRDTPADDTVAEGRSPSCEGISGSGRLAAMKLLRQVGSTSAISLVESFPFGFVEGWSHYGLSINIVVEIFPAQSGGTILLQVNRKLCSKRSTNLTSSES